MKSKKIISLILSTLTMVTLNGCIFGKDKVNNEINKKEEIEIEKQEQNNTEFDKKTDEELEDKKSIEEENKDIKNTESDKDKVNIETKKESKSDDSLSKPSIKDKKKDYEKKTSKKPVEKKEDKKEVKKDYPKQNEKKEPIKEKIPVIKKAVTQDKKPPQISKQTGENFIGEIEQMIFKKVNEERIKLGIAPLAYNYTMQKYARDKSKDMGVKNYFSHKDLQGKLITETMKRDGISFNAWGENIGYVGGYTGNINVINKFMNTWMNSEGHRKNILSQNFKSIGVGIYKIGNKYYATQEFYR